MLINELVNYEKGLIEEIGHDNDPFYYFFDYDDRSAGINMEFQHFHRFYEIHILLDREAAHLVDGNRFELTMFDITLLRPLKLHKSIYPEGDPVKRLIIDFAIPEDPEPLLQNDISRLLSVFESNEPVLRLTGEPLHETFSHINAIFRLLTEKPEGYVLLVHTQFLQFLDCINRYKSRNIYSQKFENTIEDKIYNVTSYIHSHFAEDISLEGLAREFYISPYYLSHVFKEVTGFNVVNYIQMTRIRNAQQMLLSGKDRITDIAIACGFNSFSQFNRTFNKFVGKSPSDFRKF